MTATPQSAAGSANKVSTAGGVLFNVRTPSAYDPKKGHPLIVVYAAAGGTKDNMEPFTNLTPSALGAGYIIAYVDHVSPVNASGVTDIAAVPDQIARTWCVDRRRVYLTGHSDGGSVIYVMLARKAMPLKPAAIAPSAAGLSAKALATAAKAIDQGIDVGKAGGLDLDGKVHDKGKPDLGAYEYGK